MIFLDKGKAIDGDSLMPSIPHGHDNEIGTYEGLRHLSQTLNLAVRNCDKIAIAAVNGLAIQTGMTLALACDFRIVPESAKIGSNGHVSACSRMKADNTFVSN